MICPECGTLGAYVGLSDVECRNRACRHWSAKLELEAMRKMVVDLQRTTTRLGFFGVAPPVPVPDQNETNDYIRVIVPIDYIRVTVPRTLHFRVAVNPPFPLVWRDGHWVAA